MIYAKFWTKVHSVPQQGAEQKLRDIKFEEDLKVIRHFDGMYQDFQCKAAEAPAALEDPRRDTDSLEEEATDIMEVLNKELEKINAESRVAPKSKKTNPYAYAQNEFKKSRVISKRLNTLSIFVKKDLETKYHDNLFDEDEKEAPKQVTKKSKK